MDVPEDLVVALSCLAGDLSYQVVGRRAILEGVVLEIEVVVHGIQVGL